MCSSVLVKDARVAEGAGKASSNQLLANLDILSHDHLAHSLEPLVRREEHVFCPHKANALCTIAPSLSSILGSISVGKHLQHSEWNEGLSRRMINIQAGIVHLHRALLIHPGHEFAVNLQESYCQAGMDVQKTEHYG
jgi:hypothetical protein